MNACIRNLWFALAFTTASLAPCRRVQAQPVASGKVPIEIHGEPIDGATPTSATPVSASTNTGPKRRYPKPPSVQRRMISAQLNQLDPANSDGSTLPSGTAGSAADLARTNLLPVTSLPAPDLKLPGYLNITFATLSGFDFALTRGLADASADPAQAAAQVNAMIPPAVQSLDGKRVVIRGFLLPVRMDDGLAIEFLLMRSQSMCCYGVAPNVNEWITVLMKGRGVKPVMDQPITVAGVLHVGSTQENGFLTGIYHLDGDRIVDSAGP